MRCNLVEITPAKVSRFKRSKDAIAVSLVSPVVFSISKKPMRPASGFARMVNTYKINGRTGYRRIRRKNDENDSED